MEDITLRLNIIIILLSILILIGIYYAVLFFNVLDRVVSGTHLFGKQLAHKKRETDLEDLLAKGDAEELINKSLDWIKEEPNNPWGYWFLARAYYLLENYIESKQTLLKIQHLNPDWSETIKTWLDKVEEKLELKSI